MVQRPPGGSAPVRGVVIARLAARYSDRIVVGKTTTVYLVGVACPDVSTGTALEVTYTIRNGRYEADEVRLAPRLHPL